MCCECICRLACRTCEVFIFAALWVLVVGIRSSGPKGFCSTEVLVGTKLKLYMSPPVVRPCTM